MNERTWFFATDLHGHVSRYRSLLDSIRNNRPKAVLLGGDLLPHFGQQLCENAPDDFVGEFMASAFGELREEMADDYPEVLLILGNDDARAEEETLQKVGEDGLWHYVQGRKKVVDGVPVYGYAYVPPTPFHLKDWERYDVSRFVDPGCVSPEEGYRTVDVPKREVQWSTIAEDLQQLAGDEDLSDAVFLFHSPPYQTKLDRAALDGKTVDHVPLDVHVGSIAIRRFIKERQPAVTFHGHVHESARLTGSWRDRIGDTHCLSAAHDGPELALVALDPQRPRAARRALC